MVMMNTRHLAILVCLTIGVVLALSSNVVMAGEEALLPPLSGLKAVEPLPPGQVSAQVVLWDQTGGGGPTGNDDNSSHYTGVSSGFSRQVADDFVISETVHTVWFINSVEVIGVASGPSIGSSVSVQFYNDLITSTVTGTIHIPGKLIYSAVVNVPIVTGTLSLPLPSAPVLSSSTYWVSVQANLGSVSNDTWRWTERYNTSPYPGTRPSAMMGYGGSNTCQGVWKPRKEFCWIGINPDMQFRLKGIKVTFTNFLYLPIVLK